jgi:hypothetical protein
VATFNAIAATSQAILGLLSEAVPRPEFGTAQFELYQGVNLQAPMDEGVSLYLYRVTLNTSQRNQRPYTARDGKRFRPRLPVDLYYLLTPWAKTAAKQQRLLGLCMRALEDTPILPAGLLNHYGPEPETFHPEETVELVCDPLSHQDMMSMLDILKPNYPLSVSYVARLIMIESLIETTEAGPVQTREFDLAKVTP